MLTVKPLLKRVNPKTFINDYLRANGIQDVDKYLHPDASCFDRPEDYPNIDEACECVKSHVKNKDKIGVLVD